MLRTLNPFLLAHFLFEAEKVGTNFGRIFVLTFLALLALVLLMPTQQYITHKMILNDEPELCRELTAPLFPQIKSLEDEIAQSEARLIELKENPLAATHVYNTGQLRDKTHIIYLNKWDRVNSYTGLPPRPLILPYPEP